MQRKATMKNLIKTANNRPSRKIKNFILVIVLFFIASCSTKPQSLKVIETIKEDIKQTEIKIEVLEKEYKQLITEKPECKNETIITNIESIKSDISNLSNKITVTEYLIQTETRVYHQEIKAIKTTNILLKVFLVIAVGLTILITKSRK